MRFLEVSKDINRLGKILMLLIFIFLVNETLFSRNWGVEVDFLFLVMAFVTYILLSAFLSGIQGHFSPEQFSVTASYAFGVVLFEFVAIKLGCYLLSIGGQGQVL